MNVDDVYQNSSPILFPSDRNGRTEYFSLKFNLKHSLNSFNTFLFENTFKYTNIYFQNQFKSISKLLDFIIPQISIQITFNIEITFYTHFEK